MSPVRETLSKYRFPIVVGAAFACLLAPLVVLAVTGATTRINSQAIIRLVSKKITIPATVLDPSAMLVPPEERSLQGEIVRAFPFNGCCNISNVESFPSNLVVVGAGNCTYGSKLKHFQYAQPAGVILTEWKDPSGGASQQAPLEFAAVVISEEDAEVLTGHLGTPGSLFLSEEAVIDPSFVLLISLVWMATLLAALWQKGVRRKAELQHLSTPWTEATDVREKRQMATGLKILLLYTSVVLVSAVISFFLPRAGEIVTLVGFCFGALLGAFACLKAVFELTSLANVPGIRLLSSRKFRVSFTEMEVSILDVVIVVPCLLLLAGIGLERYLADGWVLQLVGGLALATFLLSEMNFVTFRAALLLVTLYLGFVSLLSLLSFQVTTVGDGPTLLEDLHIPHFLGHLHGDEVVKVIALISSGLLVAYCSFLDTYLKTSHPTYLVTALWGYLAGLVVSLGFKFLLRNSIPIELFVIPCTLIPVLLVGRLKKHLHLIWTAPPSAINFAPEGIPMSALTHPAAGPEGRSILHFDSEDDIHDP